MAARPRPRAPRARTKKAGGLRGSFIESVARYAPVVLWGAVASIVVMYFDVKDHEKRLAEVERKTEGVQVIATNVDNLEKTMNDKFSLLMDLVKGIRDDVKGR